MTEISIDKEIYDLSTELGNAVIKGAIKEGSVYKCDKFDNRVQTTRTGNPREIRFKKDAGKEIVFGTGKLQSNKSIKKSITK